MAVSSPFLQGGLQNILRLTEQAVRGGDMPRALQLAADAVAGGVEHVNLLTLAVYHALNAGAVDRAVELGTRARKLAPRDADALQDLAV
ncbi:MAG TPA: hypothetical protein VGC36_11490, partial [Rhizomicrobium sp.]